MADSGTLFQQVFQALTGSDLAYDLEQYLTVLNEDGVGSPRERAEFFSLGGLRYQLATEFDAAQRALLGLETQGSPEDRARAWMLRASLQDEAYVWRQLNACSATMDLLNGDRDASIAPVYAYALKYASALLALQSALQDPPPVPAHADAASK